MVPRAIPRAMPFLKAQNDNIFFIQVGIIGLLSENCKVLKNYIKRHGFFLNYLLRLIVNYNIFFLKIQVSINVIKVTNKQNIQFFLKHHWLINLENL